MGKVEDIRFNKFGRLTVVCRAENVFYSSAMRTQWICKCDCGNYLYITTKELKSGRVRSCGCLLRETAKTFCESRRKIAKEDKSIYNTWKNIRSRCNCDSHPEYHRYGGRGIMLCEEWNDPLVFIAWCKENGWQKGLDIDRIDNDGNYEPSNCQFLTRSANVRKQKKKYVINGIEMTEGDIDKATGHYSGYAKYLRRRYGDVEMINRVTKQMQERRLF